MTPGKRDPRLRSWASSIVQRIRGSRPLDPVRRESDRKIKLLHTALLAFERSHGRLPNKREDWVALLVDGGYAEPDSFVSPAAVDTTAISFFYVPRKRLYARNDLLLVYEAPGLYDDGITVVWHDGTTAFIPTCDVALFLSGLPGGTRQHPWAPHEDPRAVPWTAGG